MKEINNAFYITDIFYVKLNMSVYVIPVISVAVLVTLFQDCTFYFRKTGESTM